jgi:hypothetical protein
MSNSPPISPVSTVNHAFSRPQSVRSVSPTLATLSPQRVSQLPQSGLPPLTATTAQSTAQTQQSTSAASSPFLTSAPVAILNKQSIVRLAKWGITWIQPTWMVLFVLFGILLALGHHLYYDSLNGITAGSASRQQWPIRFGTAFAYLVTSCLNAAVGSPLPSNYGIQSVKSRSVLIVSIICLELRQIRLALGVGMSSAGPKPFPSLH